MAIRIITVSEPIIVHAVEPVNRKGRPRIHPDRAAYRREWMRLRRVQDRVDAVLLAQMD
jgi:hypothetical protein